jgi:bifunctional DNA-binding transcriptional regulator/antitoxin component of YhaV-PrlF toxin-antitoxin module
MNQIIETTGFIRNRGQLTLPDLIREKLAWANSGLAITIRVVEPETIIIKPYSPPQKYNWDKIWKAINSARKIQGKGKGNMAQFISEDRYRH